MSPINGFVFLLVLALSAQAVSLDQVKFSTPDIQPSAFKIKKAKAQGRVLEPVPGIELIAYLGMPAANNSAPASSEPNEDGHPAIILLHGGDGFGPSYESWAELLTDAGYVTLLVDSFKSRGITWKDESSHYVDSLFDGYAGYQYLTEQPSVDTSRIAVIGWSYGGAKAFSMIDKDFTNRDTSKNIKAAVLFYAHCDSTGGNYSAPMLILMGDSDPSVRTEGCQIFKNKITSKSNGQIIDLRIYKGATHFYDNPMYDKKLNESVRSSLFGWEVNFYDKKAHKASIKEVLGFLKKNL